MQFEVGQIVEGKITGITKFGAFVDIGGGVTGLVHISEVSNTYVEDIAEYLSMNQEVKVKILSIDEKNKISLSIKKTEPKPENSRNTRDRKPAFKKDDGGVQRPAFNNAAKPAAKKPASREAEFNPNAATTPKGPQQFEDMLSKFMTNSEDKISGLKQQERRSRKGSKKY